MEVWPSTGVVYDVSAAHQLVDPDAWIVKRWVATIAQQLGAGRRDAAARRCLADDGHCDGGWFRQQALRALVDVVYGEDDSVMSALPRHKPRVAAAAAVLAAAVTSTGAFSPLRRHALWQLAADAPNDRREALQRMRQAADDTADMDSGALSPGEADLLLLVREQLPRAAAGIPWRSIALSMIAAGATVYIGEQLRKSVEMQRHEANIAFVDSAGPDVFSGAARSQGWVDWSKDMYHTEHLPAHRAAVSTAKAFAAAMALAVWTSPAGLGAAASAAAVAAAQQGVASFACAQLASTSDHWGDDPLLRHISGEQARNLCDVLSSGALMKAADPATLVRAAHRAQALAGAGKEAALTGVAALDPTFNADALRIADSQMPRLAAVGIDFVATSLDYISGVNSAAAVRVAEFVDFWLYGAGASSRRLELMEQLADGVVTEEAAAQANCFTLHAEAGASLAAALDARGNQSMSEREFQQLVSGAVGTGHPTCNRELIASAIRKIRGFTRAVDNHGLGASDLADITTIEARNIAYWFSGVGAGNVPRATDDFSDERIQQQLNVKSPPPRQTAAPAQPAVPSPFDTMRLPKDETMRARSMYRRSAEAGVTVTDSVTDSRGRLLLRALRGLAVPARSSSPKGMSETAQVLWRLGSTREDVEGFFKQHGEQLWADPQVFALHHPGMKTSAAVELQTVVDHVALQDDSAKLRLLWKFIDSREAVEGIVTDRRAAEAVGTMPSHEDVRVFRTSDAKLPEWGAAAEAWRRGREAMMSAMRADAEPAIGGSNPTVSRLLAAKTNSIIHPYLAALPFQRRWGAAEQRRAEAALRPGAEPLLGDVLLRAVDPADGQCAAPRRSWVEAVRDCVAALDQAATAPPLPRCLARAVEAESALAACLAPRARLGRAELCELLKKVRNRHLYTVAIGQWKQQNAARRAAADAWRSETGTDASPARLDDIGGLLRSARAVGHVWAKLAERPTLTRADDGTVRIHCADPAIDGRVLASVRGVAVDSSADAEAMFSERSEPIQLTFGDGGPPAHLTLGGLPRPDDEGRGRWFVDGAALALVARVLAGGGGVDDAVAALLRQGAPGATAEALETLIAYDALSRQAEELPRGEQQSRDVLRALRTAQSQGVRVEDMAVATVLPNALLLARWSCLRTADGAERHRFDEAMAAARSAAERFGKAANRRSTPHQLLSDAAAAKRKLCALVADTLWLPHTHDAVSLALECRRKGSAAEAQLAAQAK